MSHQTIGKEEKPNNHIIYYEIYVIQFKLNSKKGEQKTISLTYQKKKKKLSKRIHNYENPKGIHSNKK